jgi:G3E family GTPase
MASMTSRIDLSMLHLFPSPAAGPFGRRLKHARGGRMPVTVVTGSLGAGKSTLIRHFLATPEGVNTAVVRESADQTVLLGNACLCCKVRSDLQRALTRLLTERERGEVSPFSRILIETGGLADPGPILSTFATDRALGGEFHLEAVVAVVDAVAGRASLERSAVARKQVILADRLVLTKSDLADRAAIEELTRRLGALNPRAAIVTAVDGALEPKFLLASGEGARSSVVAQAEHGDGIASFVLIESAPMEWHPFALAMETLIALRGPDLLRVKGWLNLAGCRGPVVVEFIQHLAHPPVELAEWPDGERASRLVFIARNLPERSVRELFAAMRALAAGGGS